MSDSPILELRGVSKSFGAVQALYQVDFHVAPGEVMALVGDNGAGKSTLIKCIAGIHPIDEGEILFEGKPVNIHGPKDAAGLGIEVVYQDLALADNLDVVQNMYLGREEIDGIRRLDETAMEARAKDTLAGLSVTTIRSVRQTVAGLSGGQRQSVAVAKAVMWNSKVVILDEPTAALGVAQTKQVLDLVQRLGEQGLAVILISHNLHDIFQVADSITVLRLGQNVSWIAGAALGGLVVAATSPGVGIAVDAASFLVAAVLLALIRLPATLRMEASNFLADLTEGWREFSSRTWLWVIVLQFGFVNAMILGVEGVLGPATAKEDLGGPAAWGLIVTAQSFGLIVGGLLLLRVRPRRLLQSLLREGRSEELGRGLARHGRELEPAQLDVRRRDLQVDGRRRHLVALRPSQLGTPRQHPDRSAGLERRVRHVPGTALVIGRRPRRLQDDRRRQDLDGDSHRQCRYRRQRADDRSAQS